MEKKRSKKIKILKISIFILVIAIFAYETHALFPIMKNIATQEGRMEFREKILQSGWQGMVMLFGLELAQIILAILPGEPLEILAGMCYGSIGGAIFLTISVFLTTIILYYAVKKYGKSLVYEFCSKEKIDKIEKSQIYNNPNKIEIILLLLFFIPGTPKDLLTYIGGLLPIKSSHFILIATFARFPSIISSTIVGNSIIHGKWTNLIWVYLLTFLLVVVMILLIHIFDKNKETKKAFEEIQ